MYDLIIIGSGPAGLSAIDFAILRPPVLEVSKTILRIKIVRSCAFLLGMLP